ncbi:MAG: hypothetical protein EB101_12155, partial [Chitinophagia bacterium]|nr:hypothetical protein [Chitinophagia bacterium]
SPHILKAKRIYKVKKVLPSRELARRSGCSISALKAIVRKGEGFAATQVMKLTLSCDHRSVDGATGAAFLQTVKRFLENPVRLFL